MISIIKKIGIALFVMMIFTPNFGYVASIDPIGNVTNRDREYISYDPTVGKDVASDTSSGSKIFGNKLQGILNLPKPADYGTSLGYVISLIQIAINWLLGILAFISLVYMIYCGILVLTSGSDSKNANKGKKGISTAAIAIAGIGLSWLIVSAIMWFIVNIANVGD